MEPKPQWTQASRSYVDPAAKGEFVARLGEVDLAYCFQCGVCSGSNGLLRLAVNVHLVAFPEGQRFMIVKRQYGGSRF